MKVLSCHANAMIEIYFVSRRFLFTFFLILIHCRSSIRRYTVLLRTSLYLLTPWCRVLLEKLTGLQLIKKFPAFHGTRRFIPALTSVRHLSLFWASPIQPIYPHPTSWRSILILSTHLRLGLPSGLLPFGFPTKTLYTLLSSPIRATCPAPKCIDVQISVSSCCRLWWKSRKISMSAPLPSPQFGPHRLWFYM